jgi:hypothetical protein
MYNENVADFRFYAAILFSEFVLFLDGVTAALARKYPVQSSGGARSYCTGFEEILAWLRSYAQVAAVQHTPPPAA